MLSRNTFLSILLRKQTVAASEAREVTNVEIYNNHSVKKTHDRLNIGAYIITREIDLIKCFKLDA